MSPQLLEPAELLHRNARAIRAAQGVEMNAFTRALSTLERISEELGVPLAIVGGLAGIRHRAVITTLDIDVVVPRASLGGFLSACVAHGMIVRRESDRGWHKLEFPDPDGAVDIEVVPEGGRTPRDPVHAPPVPSPQALGVAAGVGYASFAGWVGMKLVASREKDRYHLTEALKQASQKQIADVVLLLRSMPKPYLSEFERLVRAAEEEKQENW